jgi:hypothetical protein
MTEDIIRMAREACDKDKVDAWHNGFLTLTQEELERFFQAAYAAGAAAEREALADMVANCNPRATPKGIAAALRARGEKK